MRAVRAVAAGRATGVRGYMSRHEHAGLGLVPSYRAGDVTRLLDEARAQTLEQVRQTVQRHGQHVRDVMLGHSVERRWRPQENQWQDLHRAPPSTWYGHLPAARQEEIVEALNPAFQQFLMRCSDGSPRVLRVRMQPAPEQDLERWDGGVEDGRLRQVVQAGDEDLAGLVPH